ncbi:hypothetical protein [Litorisediminicola beolgyonensis]|uniref:Secreted protein n=1 Tax=Litorisediminicola beolgyonensis TaxID=1173614 RepID=A0ABW3ZGF0_9RHOB
MILRATLLSALAAVGTSALAATSAPAPEDEGEGAEVVEVLIVPALPPANTGLPEEILDAMRDRLVEQASARKDPKTHRE